MNKVAKLVPIEGLVAKDGDNVILSVKKGTTDFVQVSLNNKNIGYLAKDISSASKITKAADIAAAIGEHGQGVLVKNGRGWTVKVKLPDSKSVYYVIGGGNKAIFPAKTLPVKELGTIVKNIKTTADNARIAVEDAKKNHLPNLAQLEAALAEAEKAVNNISTDGHIPLVIDKGNNLFFLYKNQACCSAASKTDGAFKECQDILSKEGIQAIPSEEIFSLLPDDLKTVDSSIVRQFDSLSWLIRLEIPNATSETSISTALDVDDLLDGVPENDRNQIETRLSWLNKVAPNLKDDIIGKFLNRMSTHTGITSFKPTFVDNKDCYVERCVSGICLGMNLRLVGPAGCGKNRLVDTLQSLFDVDISDMAFNADTNQDSLLGVPTVTTSRETDDTPKVNKLFSQVLTKLVNRSEEAIKKNGAVSEDDINDNETDWIPLLEAMKSDTAVIKFQLSDMMEKAMKPSLLNFDEVNMAPGYITALLHPLTDHRRYVNIPGYGMLKLNDEAFVVCTMNEEYEGTKTLNRAFRDRFLTIRFNASQTISTILRNEVPKLDTASAKQMDEVYKRIRDSIPAQIQEESLSLRSFIRAANFRVAGMNLLQAMNTAVVEDIDDTDDRVAIRSIVELLIK